MIGTWKGYYPNGNLRVEIEYVNNEGYGKSYNINGKLEFKGKYEYHNKWDGKGYDENGNIIYELINGNGKVKEYNWKGDLVFEGEYLNGKRNGKGKEYVKGKLIYEGEYLDGTRKEKEEIKEEIKAVKKEKLNV